MKLRVGTSGYSYKEWKGSFYPAKLPADGMLKFYAERFQTVEINNTFYRMPTEVLLRRWAGEVPEDFAFVLKASRRITHDKRLKDVADSVTYFLDTAQVLGERLGPVLFQLPPNFKKDVERLRDFLATIPAGQRVAFEFRHESWADPEVYQVLRDRGVAHCLSDVDDQDRTELVPTADWGYLRLRREDYPDEELKAWGDRIRSQPWSEAFVFLKHEEEGKGPKLAARFLELNA